MRENTFRMPGLESLDYSLALGGGPKQETNLSANNSPVNAKGGGFMNGLNTFAAGAEGLAALYSAYNAHKLRKQAEKQFQFEVSAMNRNLSNQSIAYNGDLDQRTRDGLALNGISEGSQEYTRRINNAASRHVDGSAL